MNGQNSTGLKLDQHKLVSEFGASIIPMYESLRQLESQEFIRLYPHRGAYVANVSMRELQEIYRIQETLEGLATRLCVPNLAQSDSGRLNKLEVDYRQAIETRNYDHSLDLSQQFSFTIYAASNNPLLCQIIQGVIGPLADLSPACGAYSESFAPCAKEL